MALRELREETGLAPDPQELTLLLREDRRTDATLTSTPSPGGGAGGHPLPGRGDGRRPLGALADWKP